jgi:hypothetical protein
MGLYPQVESGGDRPTLIRPELRRRQGDFLYVEHRIDKLGCGGQSPAPYPSQARWRVERSLARI